MDMQLNLVLTSETIRAQHAEVIRVLGRRIVHDVIEIGRRLTDVKDNHCEHGEWLPWLEQEFGWVEMTALNFMRVHEMVGKSKKFLDLDIPVSGLYLLAAPSTPEEALEQVIEVAANGEKLTLSKVKEMIATAKDEETVEKLTKQREDYEKQIEEVKTEIDRIHADLKGKLILDPDAVAKEVDKVTKHLNETIEGLEKKIEKNKEREKKRREREKKHAEDLKKSNDPPIDNAALSASASIGVQLASLASRLTIKASDMIAVEQRCLKVTGQKDLHERIGESVEHAKTIQAWVTDFIKRSETVFKKEK